MDIVHFHTSPVVDHSSFVSVAVAKFNYQSPNDLLYPLHRISFRHYSTSSDDPSEFVPVKKYTNADTDKLDIIKENANKAGIYR